MSTASLGGIEIAMVTLVRSGPARRSLIDWLSVTRQTESDREFGPLRDAVCSAIRAHTGYGEVKEMTSSGNFGEGLRFTRFGGEIKWTTRTQAEINDWDEQGRCVGAMNVTLRGGTGIGSLPVDKAFSLVHTLGELGFDRCRRIDTTIDYVDDWDLSLFHMRRQLAEGYWRIPRRDPKAFAWNGAVVERYGTPTPGTLYLAPASSDSRLAIYDKGAEQEQERAWLRFEARHSRDAAQGLFDELQRVNEGVMEGDLPLHALDRFVTAAVRRSGDIRDVTGFESFPKLPKNWMRSPTAKTPDELAPVFGMVAPLDISDHRIKGGFASQVRHTARSSGRTIWKLCIIAISQGNDPGPVAMDLGFTSFGLLTAEDFQEMAQTADIPVADLEKAELKAITQKAQSEGVDLEVVSSHRTELRAEALKRVGGLV